MGPEWYAANAVLVQPGCAVASGSACRVQSKLTTLASNGTNASQARPWQNVQSLGRVQSVPKTAAYRTTFGNTGLQSSMGDVLRAVEDKAASCLTAFAKQHVFTEIVTDIGMGIRLSWQPH